MTHVQLRRYRIAPGKLDVFVEHWREVVLVREKYGFTALFGFANRSTDEFIWAVRHDGDFEQAYAAYEASAEHKAIVERMRPLGLLTERHTGMVDVIAAPRTRAKSSADIRQRGPVAGPQPAETTMAEVELRRFDVVPGQMDAFLVDWRRLVPVREKYEFTTLFAFADRSRDEVTWAICHDGDFAEADQAFKASDEHTAIRNDLLPHMNGNQHGKVDVILAPGDLSR